LKNKSKKKASPQPPTVSESKPIAYLDSVENFLVGLQKQTGLTRHEIIEATLFGLLRESHSLLGGATNIVKFNYEQVQHRK